jgi:hypothetical protein
VRPPAPAPAAVFPAATRALAAAALAVLAACGGPGGGEARADPAPPARAATRAAPVVVELFTSQGCSSCPPADRYLSEIATAGAVDGRPVVALAYHVDYWNDLGWADPFSRAAWSARQGRYGHALGAGRVYTPELVVAGAADAVGSSRGRVRALIAHAPAQRAITARARRDGARLHVTATAPAGADVWVALWEDGLVTQVPRGENAGARLVSDRIVRRLVRVARAGATGAAEVAIDPAWKHVGAVAFAQRPDLAIVGATVLRVE